MSEEITNRSDLTVIALKERIGQIASDYEGKIADLRTDATIQIAALNARIEELEAELNAQKEDANVGEEAKTGRKAGSKAS